MTISILSNLDKLDKKDEQKITYFMQLLLNQKKYNKTKQEITHRRSEIKKGQTLNHHDIWNELNV